MPNYIVTTDADPEADTAIIATGSSVEDCIEWLNDNDTESEDGEKRYIHEVRSPVIVKARVKVEWLRV